MEAKLILKDGILKYTSSKNLGQSRQEPNWSLPSFDIKVIATNRIMDGDDDSFYFVLVNFDNELFFLNNTWNKNASGIETLLKETFDLDIDWEATIDTNQIIYPKELAGQRLYEGKSRNWKTFVHELKRLFRVGVHNASGIIREEIAEL